MRLPRTSRLRATISLTPLIDVVFLLLVFFILAGQFREDRARLTLTQAQSGAAQGGQVSYLLVRVHAADTVDLAGERMSMAGLLERLRGRQQQPEGLYLALAPVGRLDLGAFVAVVDGLRSAGFANLALLPG